MFRSQILLARYQKFQLETEYRVEHEIHSYRNLVEDRPGYRIVPFVITLSRTGFHYCLNYSKSVEKVDCWSYADVLFFLCFTALTVTASLLNCFALRMKFHGAESLTKI